MVKKKLKKLYGRDAREFFNQVMVEQPLLPFLIPLGLFAWFVERWVVPFSNWVPLAAAVWATIQVCVSAMLYHLNLFRDCDGFCSVSLIPC
jgi:hypothetical protein